MTLDDWKKWIDESQLTYEDVMDFIYLQDVYTDARRDHQLLHIIHEEDPDTIYGEWGNTIRSRMVKTQDRLRDNKFYRSIPKKI